KLKKKPPWPLSAVGATLAETRTETTAGETFSTLSAKLGTCCGLSIRTASASTSRVPPVSAPKLAAPAIDSEAAAASRRAFFLEALELLLFSISAVLFTRDAGIV